MKCDYCERRGHVWEECPIRTLTPAVRVAAPVQNSAQTAKRAYQPRYDNNYQRPPPARKLICWRCQKEGHFARDYPDTLKHQPTNVNVVHPKLAVITRAHQYEARREAQAATTHPAKWQKLKQEAAQITKGLGKIKPLLELDKTKGQPCPKKPNTKAQKWVRKTTAPDACSLEEVRAEDALEEKGSPEEAKYGSKELWKEVTERVTKLSLELEKLVKAVPVLEELLEKEGLKTAYEVNRASIRDDRAPVINVDCKIRKHWKPVEKATLDGGAGVNVMSERVRKRLGLQSKPAPFKLRMANQTITPWAWSRMCLSE